MTESLFRKEVIESQSQRLLGDVILIRPLSFWVYTLGSLLFILIVLTILITGSFARRESVIGYLVPDKGVVRVLAPISGTIESKEVLDGDRVKKGDLLFKVSTQKDSHYDLSVNQQLIEQINHREQQIDQIIADEILLSNKESKRMESVISGLKLELIQLDQKLSTQENQLDLARSQLKKSLDLQDRGLVLEPDVVQKRNIYLSAQNNIDTTNQSIISKHNELNNVEKELEQIPLRHRARLQELENTKTQLREKKIELNSNEAYAIKASIDGRVTSVQSQPGQIVSASEPLLRIIPNDTTLFAELFLPSRAIGFVNKGQEVLIRYDAFPFQQYGLYEGEIIQVAEAVINPKESTIPINISEPVYRVKVALNSQSVTAQGKEMPLQAGMSVSADIILEERTLGEWLLAPIYSLRGKIHL